MHSFWTLPEPEQTSAWSPFWELSETRSPDCVTSPLWPSTLFTCPGIMYKVMRRERNCWKCSRQHCMTGLSRGLEWHGPEERRPVLTVECGWGVCSASSGTSPWYWTNSVKPLSERQLGVFSTSSKTSSVPGPSRVEGRVYQKKKRQRKKDRQKCRHYPSVSGLFSEKLSDFLLMIFFSIQNQNKGIKLNEGCRDVLKHHHGHCHSRPFEV